MRVYGKHPDGWDELDSRPPLFASRAWLDHIAHRIEGEHRWLIHEAGVGFFGSLIHDPGVTASKNVWLTHTASCAP